MNTPPARIEDRTWFLKVPERTTGAVCQIGTGECSSAFIDPKQTRNVARVRFPLQADGVRRQAPGATEERM
jgi:hypothetical protein